jgi:hypothetical protein
MRNRDVFPKIVPPPGGVGELRRRMREEASPSPRAWWPRLLPLTAVAVAATVVCMVIRRPIEGPLAAARSFGGASAVALGLATAPSETATLEGESRETAALAQLPTADPHVVMYLVGTLEE